MKTVGIFNHVLGPVMRGPSSSHTAGSYHIGALARSLLGGEPETASFIFDPDGSYAHVFRRQGSDLAFAAGLMGWEITDERFQEALAAASAQGLKIHFSIESIAGANHPNTVEIRLSARNGRHLRAIARSIGGGAILFSSVQDWPVSLAGDCWDVLAICRPEAEAAVHAFLEEDSGKKHEPERQSGNGLVLLHARRSTPLPPEARSRFEATPGLADLMTAKPVFFLARGKPMFSTAAEMVALAERRRRSLGETALEYEAKLLGWTEEAVLAEMSRRYRIMHESVHRGLAGDHGRMQLLSPCAGRIYRAEAEGRTAAGGLHTRAAARALAAMHTNAGMGVVCAAPTAGSAGVLPAVAFTLEEEKKLDPRQTAMALFAASAVGIIVAVRATFAAESAGCQVEIGAAGAMAAAAVVEAAGGSARKACDAAAVAFQNTMGSICDPVQGAVEIPCHTRNAVAASSAFVCADLVLGGYRNPIPLDETIDAVGAVGRMLPRELKCTALGGLSLAPSACALRTRK